MPSPFPGMNPYLENPEIWPEVHNRLIVAISDSLVPQLLPKYRVAIEKRVYQMNSDNSLLVGIPDVTIQKITNQSNSPTSNIAVAAPPVTALKVRVPMLMEFRETYLEVREIATQKVITVIELLSPKNKRPGEGREAYLNKRQKILSSSTHLVEIDLLRAGEAMPVFGNDFTANYRILVSRGDCRPEADLYLFNLPNPIPTFPLPLQSGDSEPIVDLQNLLDGVYDRAAYNYIIDYTKEPYPTLSETETTWLETYLKEKTLR
ncbi:DUF4058 family protein [Aerosakkonemataceae cyanobacterium BLCC-F50]|uniref:DUF4058 family protein n=1 Tax=Floridaenema flaviceps BLCC-F50 TaxID=3153642 RepID=A0ABV4XQR2_9CYAN